jgi:hypothetical protein
MLVAISASHVFQAITIFGEQPFQEQKRRNLAALIRFCGDVPDYRIAQACGCSAWLVKKVRERGPDYPDRRKRWWRRNRSLHTQASGTTARPPLDNLFVHNGTALHHQ